MTFDDDFVRLHLITGTRNIPCAVLGLEWPPPEYICLAADKQAREATADDKDEFVLQRVSFSEITDEQREGMTHVARGAEYYYVAEAEGKEDLVEGEAEGAEGAGLG